MSTPRVFLIDKSLNDLINFFSNNWWEKYNFHKDRINEPNLDNSQQLFKQGLEKLKDELFDSLNFSILRGEYIIDSDIIIKLSSFKKKIEDARIDTTSILIPDPEIEKFLSVDYLPLFNIPIISAINYYLEFVSSVNQKLKFSEKEYILKYNDEILLEEESDSQKDNSGNLFLFQLNLEVASLDHNLSTNENHATKLFYISRHLSKKSGTKPYVLLIKKKCDYLRNKLLLRAKHDEKPKPVYSLVNGQEKLILTADLKDVAFDEWFEYLDTHYELKADWQSLVAAEFEEIKGKRIEDCSITELHRSIKYHKDVNKDFRTSINFLKSIRQEFERRLIYEKNSKNIFNAYAISISLNYAINNEFSLVCENPNTKIEDAEQLYSEIIQVQTTTGVKNFFPQTKFLFFLLNKLKEIYNEQKALESVVPCRSIINKCHDIYKKYEDNLSWTRRKYNYVFQLPYEECLIDAKDPSTDKIFIFSSFLMPLPKDKSIKEFQENKSEIFQLESSIKVFENITRDITQLNQLKESIKDREVKMMEILGVFTALISFVAASLPTFKVVDTPLEAALFMLALATSFSSFVLLLMVALRGIEKLGQHRKLISWCVGLTILFWLLIIGVSYIAPIKSFIEIKSSKEEDVSKEATFNNNIIMIQKDSVKTKSSPKMNRDTIVKDTPLSPRVDSIVKK